MIDDDTTSYVYVLVDVAEPSHYRYVGFTTQPQARLRAHRAAGENRYQGKTWKDSWIYKVYKSGSSVQMHVVAQYSTVSAALNAEDWWIEHLRCSGHRLTNLVRGGGTIWAPARDPLTAAKIKATSEASEAVQTQRLLRGEMFREYWNDPVNISTQSSRMKLYYQKNPEPTEVKSERARTALTREGLTMREARLRYYQEHPEHRESVRQAARSKWANFTPEEKADYILKIQLGKRRKRAERAGLTLQLTPKPHVCRAEPIER